MNNQLLKIPAVRILALGGLLGVALLIVVGPPSSGNEATRVVITAGDLLQIQAGFERTWQREPTRLELANALDKHIHQEVLYREALARGFDRDDSVVRRAMQRKMEFLAESQALSEPPSDEQVEAYFSLRKERYREPARISFTQVYVSLDTRGDKATQAALEILDQLRAAKPEPYQLQEWGDRLMLPNYFADQGEPEIRAQLGDDFASALIDLDEGSWQGPIRSGFGLHLVRIMSRQDSSIPELPEVAGQVVADMQYEARSAAREQLYQEIAQNYQILVDRDVNEMLESVEG